MAVVTQNKYIVTAYTMEGMERLRTQIVNKGQAPEKTVINRSVKCAEERPKSRSTTYWLTSREAISLKLNPDVRSVQPYPSDMGVQPELHAITQTSNFSRSVGQNSNHKNWGLLRSIEGGLNEDWSGDNTQTITLTETGKNVDCIICDNNGLITGHPEYAVNADGTGGSRANAYDWFTEHQAEVGGDGAGTNYSYGTAYHAVHVMGTVGGNTQGWARDANLYNLYYYTGAVGNTNFPYVYDYIREFHRTKAINPDTGVKNPTVVNSSWGMSIFPQQWTFGDITAVTYRGTRYLPASLEFLVDGHCGIYSSTSNTDLARFILGAGTNATNSYLQYNCSTSGTETQVSAEGTLNPQPQGGAPDIGWTNSGGKVAYFTSQERLETITQKVFIQTLPVGGGVTTFTADILQDMSYATPTGTVDLTTRVEVTDPDLITTTFTNGTYTGASVNNVINETITINKAGYWIVEFFYTYSTAPDSPTYDNTFRVTLNTSYTDQPSATATLVASGEANVSIDSIAGLNADTTPSVGDNDDGYWVVNLPWNVTFLEEDYSTLHVGTNGYVTFGGGSIVEPGQDPSLVPYPKIMIGSGSKSSDTDTATSGQRIYWGAVPTGIYTTPVNTYSVDAINNSNISYILSSGTDRNGAVAGDSATINILVGDTIEITNNSNFIHPLYIKTAQISGTGDQVIGATGQGATQGNTVSWTPTQTGTYYYQCSSHTSMNGQIVVGANDTSEYFRLVFEGSSTASGVVGSPDIRWEIRFDELNPDQFRVITEEINQYTTTGDSGFTDAELNAFGFLPGKRIPVPVDALDSDIEDAIAEGIINIGAAGNGQWYHAAPGDQDWDNTFEMGTRYPDSVNFPYYYMRGTSPTRVDTAATGGYELPTICVGAFGNLDFLDEKIADYSDRGPGVTIFAPGTSIQSCYPKNQTPYADPRNSAYGLGKISGTSMASPQVAGVIACLAETYPEMTCEEARDLIVNLASIDDIIDTTDPNAFDYTDDEALLGAPNLLLRYTQQRKAQGTTFPKRNYKARPSNGQMYPRSRIRR